MGSGVRKHRAPKGALRRHDLKVFMVGHPARKKALSAIRCTKTQASQEAQKAWDPGSESTERQKVIKTAESRILCRYFPKVRKHRAPKGALRLLVNQDSETDGSRSQKAPCAKRRIKTNRGAHRNLL